MCEEPLRGPVRVRGHPEVRGLGARDRDQGDGGSGHLPGGRLP